METVNEMEHINAYSRKELCEDDVYIFTVTLCDNDIDRDFERFTKETLDGLCELFCGKAGIFDHNMRAEGQSARIFRTWVEEVPEKKTADGNSYFRLRARAYMVRTENNKALIDEIDGGIKKEVSVGCAVEKVTCSVCGADMKTHGCEHIKGRTYGDKLCFGILSEPYDAYEWSFVAVPSQREAGVTKAFASSEAQVVSLVKNASQSVTLSDNQLVKLASYITDLEKTKADAEFLREKLLCEVRKCVLLAMPDVDAKSFVEGFKNMKAPELSSLCEQLKVQISKTKVPLVQLGTSNEKHTADNGAFRI